MDQDEALRNFTELTGTPTEVGRVLLQRNNWDVELALEEFYNGPTMRSRSTSPEDSHAFTDNPEQASNPPKSASRGPAPSKFKSFSQLVSETANDEDDEKNYYAGGGRGSALNVENPDEPKNLVQELMKKAERHEGHPDRMNEKEEDAQPASHFSGVGHSLGDTSTPSRKVGTPQKAKQENAKRHITFWKDGFQVGEGRLYRYDDPSNRKYLSDLNSGRAPLELLDVSMGQNVDVTVEKKLDEDYKPPKRPLGGFGGSGYRLGSPVTTTYVQPTQPVESAPEPETESAPVEEEPKGDAQVQVRLADGRRVVRRIMSTATVQELYDFVATETSSTRTWSLNHAFPVKPIDNMTQTIKEAGLANAVVVQRWA